MASHLCERCGDKDDVSLVLLAPDRLQDLPDLAAKALVKHRVRLVQNHVPVRVGKRRQEQRGRRTGGRAGGDTRQSWS